MVLRLLTLAALLATCPSGRAAESYPAVLKKPPAPQAQPLLKGARMRPAAESSDTKPADPPLDPRDQLRLADEDVRQKAARLKAIGEEVRVREARVADLRHKIESMLRTEITDLEQPAVKRKPARRPASAKKKFRKKL